MLICRKCHTEFKRYVEIQGKIRCLGSRKFCTNCSPWGVRNTRNDDPSKIRKPHTRHMKYVDFPREIKNNIVNRQYNNRINRKKQIVDLKGGSCQICGYKKCLNALSFHHRDPSTKKFELTMTNMGLKWSRILEELNKCDLLCENCHREVEMDRLILTRITSIK